MLNKLGTTEDMVIYHQNGKKSYDFRTHVTGLIIELTFDKNGKILTFKSSNGYTDLLTRDEQGNELAFKNSNGYYRIKDKDATQEEYEAFIKELEKPKTVVELPSDEEIKERANKFKYELNKVYFKLGAKWMKEQILNQNK